MARRPSSAFTSVSWAAAGALLAFAIGLVGPARADDVTAESLTHQLLPQSALGKSKGLKKPLPPSAGIRTGSKGTAEETPSASLTVEFRTGSAELSPGAAHLLGELGKALTGSSLASYRFRIEGHTDTVGSKDANQALSDRRAQAVAAYLETHFGIPTMRLEAVGMGEDGLAVPTGDQVAEPRNRRVRVVNLGT